MSDNSIITVLYEMHEGDVTDCFMTPVPKVVVSEVLHAICVGGQWQVGASDAGIVGRGERRQDAILDYLRIRLHTKGVI